MKICDSQNNWCGEKMAVIIGEIQCSRTVIPGKRHLTEENVHRNARTDHHGPQSQDALANLVQFHYTDETW